ncbi:hypothetical protein BD413DRAFT_485455 [Trametes elegans]|nr:hypothetical protein BD413DRAFT_485455 [Trametes elegans]
MSLPPDARASPFTVKEFSDLVSSAFNLDQADLLPAPSLQGPLLSFTPPSPHAAEFDSDAEQEHTSGCAFDGETDDEDHHLGSPVTDEDSPQLSPPGRRSRSRTITALRVFNQVRTRASAFVLRSRAPSASRTSPSPVPFEPIPPLRSISPTLSSTTTIPPRSQTPLSMFDLNIGRPRSRSKSRAESLPRTHFFVRESTPPPLPGRQTRPNTSAGTRSTSPALHSFFDDSPAKSKRAYSRPSTSASTVHPLSRVTTSSSAHAVLSTDGLPSFFEDTGYRSSKPVAPHYSRPSTPSGAAQRVHTRLPPLRKAKSGGYGLFGRSKSKGSEKPATSGENAHSGLGYDAASWGIPTDSHMPTSFTSPREAPAVPDGVTPLVRHSIEDIDGSLPPSYVFERRGSATSNSTASTRSSSSLSSKISSIVGAAFPGKMRTNARSKLNLSITTDPVSAHSSPSTLSSHPSPTTPVSPTAAFPRPQPYVFPAHEETHRPDDSFNESDEDALAIGRVLTPDADPFAKAEIAVPVGETPRPPTPPLSRRASSQRSPLVGLSRTPTWDEERVKISLGPAKRTRNSLPASPVSSASTFPSSCSVYGGRGISASVHSPSTPKRNAPPSAWSPFTTPAASSPSTGTNSTPQSSPKRSASSASKSNSQNSTDSPPSPSTSVFPLPPQTIPSRLPPARPPPTRALPEVPAPLPSPPAPPVPPKDPLLSRVARAHKSLPPSPRPIPSPSGSPSSVRSYQESPYRAIPSDERQPLLSLPLGAGLRELIAGTQSARSDDDEEPLLQRNYDMSDSALEGPWPGCGSDGSCMIPPSVTAGWQIRPVVRRRSVDSTSTVTASPTSSAVYDATSGWDPERPGSVVHVDRSPVLEIDTHSIGAASSFVLPPLDLSTDDHSDCCGSATSPSTFYSARTTLSPGSPA